MFKKILQIAVHRAKGGLIDLLLDITVGTLDEFRRARRNGTFDLFGNQNYDNNFNNSHYDNNDNE